MPVRLVAVMAVLMVALSAYGQRAALASTPADFPLDEVVPGLIGHALTAGAGNVIERFPITVLGVQRDAGTGFPLVLVRATGPFIERVGGVAAGMSGSPVYLPFDGEDALLGAIGYVFPEADHDVALVTPIASMRDERVAGSGDEPIMVDGYGPAVAVATPILLSGANARSATLLEPLFANAAVRPFPSQVGSGTTAALNYSLEPGAAIAVRLMSGDIDLSAIGTLTTLEGVGTPPATALDQGEAQAGHSFLAFGHPFLGTGMSSYALSAAHVLEIIASDSVPFKLANAGSDHLGAVTLDTPTALVGTIGAAAATVPLSLTFVIGNREEHFAVELAAAEKLYPTLVAVATLQAADRTLRAVGPGYAALAWEIGFADGGRLNVLEQTSSDSDVTFAAAALAAGPLAILAGNSFAEPQVAFVNLVVELDRDRNSATIESIVLEEEPVRAGDNAVIHVRLQPYRKEAIVRTFSVELPSDVGGDLTILVRGGDVPRELDGVPEEGGEVDEPRSWPELLDALRGQLQASELVIEAIDEYGDVHRLSRLALPFVVLGSQELTLSVEPEGDVDGVEADGGPS